MSDQNEENQFEEYQPEEEAEGTQEKAPTNRNFLIAIAVIGGLFLLALIAMGVFAATILPARQATQKTQAAQILMQNTSTAAAATQLAFASLQLTPSATPLPTITNTSPPPTNTPVYVAPSATTDSSGTSGTGQNKAETPDPTLLAQSGAGGGAPGAAQGTTGPTLSPAQARTATLAVLLTQVAQKNATPLVAGAAEGPTATALPGTGFADEVGLPGLLGLALGLVVLIFVIRGLRVATR